MVYLICVMAREERDIICSSKMVADLLDFPIAFSFPPFGSTILEPNLYNTKTQYNRKFSDENRPSPGHKISVKKFP